MQPTLPYMGTKREEYKRMVEEFPETYDILVDVFGGGGSVSLMSLNLGKKIHYNELEAGVYQYFHLLKEEEEEKKCFP